jgi:hypothetical protein
MNGLLLKFGIGGAVVLAAVIYHQIDRGFAVKEGHDKAIAEQAAADRRAELERKGDDAALQILTAYDLCVAGLRSNRMPVDACEQLRGDDEK